MSVWLTIRTSQRIFWCCFLDLVTLLSYRIQWYSIILHNLKGTTCQFTGGNSTATSTQQTANLTLLQVDTSCYDARSALLLSLASNMTKSHITQWIQRKLRHGKSQKVTFVNFRNNMKMMANSSTRYAPLWNETGRNRATQVNATP